MDVKIHECDCGYKWRHGHSGSHQCSPNYRDTIAELRAALAVESAALVDAVRHVGNLKERISNRAPSAPVALDEQKVELMRSGLALMVELKKVKADHAKVLEEAYGALLWLHRRLPAAYKPLATVDQTIESIGRSIGYDARTDLADRAALSVKAALGDPVCETGMPMRKMHRWYRRVAPGTLLYEAAPTPPTTGEA